jgi:hypothetical protein
MKTNLIWLTMIIGILWLGFLQVNPEGALSNENEMKGKSQQEEEKDHLLEIVPFFDAFSKECYEGCLYACTELVEGYSKDVCKEICEGLCGKDTTLIITVVVDSSLQSGRSIHITRSQFVSFYYELEPKGGGFFNVKEPELLYQTGRIVVTDHEGKHVCKSAGVVFESPHDREFHIYWSKKDKKYKAGQMPALIFVQHFSGDDKCPKQSANIGGLYAEMVKGMGGVVTELGGTSQNFGERIDYTYTDENGYTRYIYQWQFIQH